MSAWPLQVGDRHHIYGEVVAQGLTGGERYLWFSRGRGEVAMMPACMFAKHEPQRCSTCAHANHEDGEAGVIYCTNRQSFFNGKPMPGTGAWCEKWEGQ
jgi:hypothetical protein